MLKEVIFVKTDAGEVNKSSRDDAWHIEYNSTILDTITDIGGMRQIFRPP